MTYAEVLLWINHIHARIDDLRRWVRWLVFLTAIFAILVGSAMGFIIVFVNVMLPRLVMVGS